MTSTTELDNAALHKQLPPPLPTQDMFGETFVVKVSGTAFTLHKGVASFSSDYFKAALKENTFKEGTENVIEWPDADVECFKKLVVWMYTRQLVHDGEDKNDEFKKFRDATRLWIMRRSIPGTISGKHHHRLPQRRGRGL